METAIEFIKSVRDETDGFSFGQPWKYDEFSTTAVLPVFRENGRKRSYLVLDEAENVVMEDTGSISSVLVTNNEPDPIFIRAGHIFAGSTQERAARMSRAIMAHMADKIDVVCVHRSRPITRGAKVYTSGYTPSSIDLFHQGVAWQSADRYSKSTVDTLARLRSRQRKTDVALERRAAVEELSRYKEDDLKANRDSFSKAIEEVLEQVPSAEKQVGMALVDASGLVALEVFDHSASWMAARPELLRRVGQLLAEIDPNNPWDSESRQVIEQTAEPLAKLVEADDLYQDQASQTLSLISGNLSGEVTLIGERAIHLHLDRIG